jgi:hypothetical protein
MLFAVLVLCLSMCLSLSLSLSLSLITPKTLVVRRMRRRGDLHFVRVETIVDFRQEQYRASSRIRDAVRESFKHGLCMHRSSFRHSDSRVYDADPY